MDTTTNQLFVYGSLRSGFHNPAYAYLTKYFHLLGEAVVKGKFYDNVTHPVGVPCKEDSFITGELYAVNNPDEFKWVVDQLDDYEGLNVEAGETPLFRRETVQVFQEGISSSAWIYWFNGSVEQMKEITTGDVLNYLQQQNKP